MNAICRLANVKSCVGHFLFTIILAIAFLLALPLPQAKAVTESQAIDIAVDAAVIGGREIGLNVPPEAAHLLKELVKCGLDGGTVPARRRRPRVPRLRIAWMDRS